MSSRRIFDNEEPGQPEDLTGWEDVISVNDEGLEAYRQFILLNEPEEILEYLISKNIHFSITISSNLTGSNLIYSAIIKDSALSEPSVNITAEGGRIKSFLGLVYSHLVAHKKKEREARLAFKRYIQSRNERETLERRKMIQTALQMEPDLFVPLIRENIYNIIEEMKANKIKSGN